LKLRKTTSVVHEMLKTIFDNNAMERTQALKLFSQFKHGETLVEDTECSGHPSTGNRNESVEEVCRIVNKD
jgi:hypothetical protein